MSAPIEVLEMRRVEACGSVRACAKLRVGGFKIHGVKVIQQPDQRPWIALPQQPARAKADGSGAGWFPVIEATPELISRIRAVVLEHCSRWRTSASIRGTSCERAHSHGRAGHLSRDR